MTRVNAESRHPDEATGSQKVIAARDTHTITDPVDAWALLADCPTASVPWAGVGYFVGTIQTRADIADDFKQAGRAAASYATTAIWPLQTTKRLDEVRAEVITSPCPAKCRRCSRCARSLSFWSRSGRDYLGVAGERALVGA